MHNGHYYFDKMPKEVQENFKKAYERKIPFEGYLNHRFASASQFINVAFSISHLDGKIPYWYTVIGLLESKEWEDNNQSLYTLTDLVKFGNYLLSPERKVTHEENRGVVTDADLEWINLNKE